MNRSSVHRRAFSLVEILVVIGIMSILMGIAVVSMKGQGSQEFSKSISEIGGTLELCQTHALSNRATVRVLFGTDNNDLIALPLVFSQGGVPTEEESNEMENGKLWVPMTKPLAARNVQINDEFVPPAQEILSLTDSKIKTTSRTVAGKSISFDTMIQFSPSGEAALDNSGKAVRGVQWGLESTGPKKQKAVIRVSGLTGRVQILREEDLVKLAP